MNHIQTPACRSVKAAAVDEVSERRARSNRALELRVERARYDAARAERAFHACEPENRLVARSLENRWEHKLRELQDAEAELAGHATATLEPSREQIEALARDVPRAVGREQHIRERPQAAAARADQTTSRSPPNQSVASSASGSAGAQAQPSSTRSSGRRA